MTSIVLSVSAVRGTEAQVIRDDLYVTDGPVRAIARSGNTLYIGGQFSLVGPATGGGVPLDATSGIPVSGFPKIAGVVSAVASDGAGGWYVGGEFNAVGGVPRSNLAHILADFSLAPWAPEPDGNVASLAVSGTTVFVSGSFSTIGGAVRNQLAALDAATGFATAWNPNRPDGSSLSVLTASGQTVYVRGDFTSIGGQARNGLAALDATTGLATAWDPDPDAGVAALAVVGTTVYVGGAFTSIGGQARNYLAAVDVSTGLATGWNPNLNGEVFTLAASDSAVYASGTFLTTISDGTQYYGTSFAAFDIATGLPRQWSSHGSVWSMALSGMSLYVCGYVQEIGGAWSQRYGLAAVDARTGSVTAWDPPQPNEAGGGVALAANDSAVYVGGGFTTLGGQARSCLAALDLTTGSVTDWNPDVRPLSYSANVNALAVAGSTLYVGGVFRLSIPVPFDTAATRYNLAAFDLATGKPTSWNPNRDELGPNVVQQRIATLVPSGSTLYVGGRFNHLAGATRNHIAQLDLTTGEPTTWNPSASDSISAIAVSGSTVYVAGTFDHIGALPRNGLAALNANAHDSTDDVTTAWDPDPWPAPIPGGYDPFGRPLLARGPVRAIAVSGATIYVGGEFDAMGGCPCENGALRHQLAALDATTGLVTQWDPGVVGMNPRWNQLYVSALGVSGATVYVGGCFVSIGGQSRNMLAALDAGTASVTAWDPDANGAVLALLIDGATVYAAGGFTRIGGQAQGGVAAIGDLSTPALLSLVSADAQAGRVRLVWYAAGGQSLVATIYRSRSGGEWNAIARITGDGTGRLSYEDSQVSAGAQYGYRLGIMRSGTEGLLGEVWVNVPGTARFSLSGVRPNPTPGSLNVAFSLPDGSPAQLELLDIAGRRLFVREVGSLGAGDHVVRLENGSVPAAGLFFVRLTHGGQALTARALVIH